MNCIFLCVFNNEGYLSMLYLLLESIYLYANLENDTDILIYTSTEFMNRIKKSHLYSEKIKFEINDTYNSIEKACKSRLDLFHLPSANNYTKFLYLDTDILIKDDIHKVFGLIKEDLLYAIGEGNIAEDHSDWWGGKSLFGEEVHQYEDKTAFCSGVLLFNHCEKMKYLFDKIQEDMQKRNHYFYDQPFFVYNAFKYQLHNNKLLSSLAINNNFDINSDKVIHHFLGIPGYPDKKIKKMTVFLNSMKEISYQCFEETLHIEHDIWTCSSKMRKDISDFFVAKKHFSIAEIGSHKGYTTKILSQIFSKVYAVDNSVEWTNFNRNFNKEATNVEYVMLDLYRDSWDVLPENIEVSFIDAVHSYDGCKSDIMNSIKRLKKLEYIIFDDYGVWPGVKHIVNELMETKTLLFERFIGINDVPGPYGIVPNVNEGIICSVNKVNNKIKNKQYTWENSSITFLDDFEMDAFGRGHYGFVDEYNIIANFGGRIHYIKFNEDYTTFSSIRKDDSQNVTGRIIQ